MLKTVSAETEFERSDHLFEIGTAELYDHPANPPDRVTPEAIANLAESIRDFGQRETVRVREIDKQSDEVRFQILSGHRRVAACRQLGIDVRVEFVECSDAEALREVMLGNAERTDLSPTERAELLQTMIDSGIDRAEAGRMFGLGSESGIKNALRILKLPKSCRELLHSGELPARAARYLIPYAEAPKILDRFAKEFRESEWIRGEFLAEPGHFEIVQPDDYRPVDGKTKYSPGWQYEDTTRQFELDEKTYKKLKVVDLPAGEKGEMLEVALNVKLFDELNKPHVQKKTYGGAAVRKTLTKPTEELTPQQKAAEKRRKRREADAKLKKRLPIWAQRFRRCLLATQTPVNSPVIPATLPWWIYQCVDEMLWLRGAANSLGAGLPETWYAAESNQLLAGLIAVSDELDTNLPAGHVILDRLWRILVWPRWGIWPAGEVAGEATERIPAEPPKRLPDGDEGPTLDEPLEMQLKMAGTSIAAGWDASRDAGTPEHEMVLEYLKLHDAHQLTKLAGDAVDLGGETRKGKIVELLDQHHRESKALPIPEVLQPKPKKRKARKKVKR